MPHANPTNKKEFSGSLIGTTVTKKSVTVVSGRKFVKKVFFEFFIKFRFVPYKFNVNVRELFPEFGKRDNRMSID